MNPKQKREHVLAVLVKHSDKMRRIRMPGIEEATETSRSTIIRKIPNFKNHQLGAIRGMYNADTVADLLIEHGLV